jgi:hypothetical protein
MDWNFISPQKKIPMTTYGNLLNTIGVAVRVVKETGIVHAEIFPSLLHS